MATIQFNPLNVNQANGYVPYSKQLKLIFGRSKIFITREP